MTFKQIESAYFLKSCEFLEVDQGPRNTAWLTLTPAIFGVSVLIVMLWVMWPIYGHTHCSLISPYLALVFHMSAMIYSFLAHRSFTLTNLLGCLTFQFASRRTGPCNWSFAKTPWHFVVAKKQQVLCKLMNSRNIS